MSQLWLEKASFHSSLKKAIIPWEVERFGRERESGYKRVCGESVIMGIVRGHEEWNVWVDVWLKQWECERRMCEQLHGVLTERVGVWQGVWQGVWVCQMRMMGTSRWRWSSSREEDEYWRNGVQWNRVRKKTGFLSGLWAGVRTGRWQLPCIAGCQSTSATSPMQPPRHPLGLPQWGPPGPALLSWSAGHSPASHHTVCYGWGQGDPLRGKWSRQCGSLVVHSGHRIPILSPYCPH